MPMSGTPILILKEGTKREKGKEAKLDNIFAARAVAEAVRSTLGPRGMDKMLIDATGDIIITNDGATIAKEMDVQHPAAKMIVEVAKAMDQECGDGTTTAMVLAGELLKKAEDLIEMDLHPTIITRGYKLAAERSLQRVEEIAIKIQIDDEATLRRVAKTAMMSKAVSGLREHLSDVAVAAIRMITEREDGRSRVDLDNVQIIKRQGGSAFETEMVNGVVMDKEPVLTSMPIKVQGARIAILSTPLEIKKTEVQESIEISDPAQMKAFLDEEERMLREMVDYIRSKGANIVVCGKGVDELAQHFLAKANILVLQKVNQNDLIKLAKATGGNLVDRPKDLDEEDLGLSDVVEVRIIEGKEMTFVTGCRNPRAVSILIRGGTEHVVDEAERSIEDALHVVALAIEDGKITTGGGSTAMELALDLREYANRIGGREQLAIMAFSDALESIPKALAVNAGMDPMDIVIELRRRHRAGSRGEGVAVLHGGTMDMIDAGVLEPIRLVRQEINSAVDAAIMVIRIDDVISSKRETVKSGE